MRRCWLQVFSTFVCAAQVGLVVTSVWFELQNSGLLRLNEVWVHYLAQIINFSGIYLMMVSELYDCSKVLSAPAH